MRTMLAALTVLLCGAAAAHAQLDLPPRQWDSAIPLGKAPISLAASAAAPVPPAIEPIGILALQEQREASLGRHLAWGATIGAAAGVLTSLFVISQCEEMCDENRAANVALHVGIGAAAGGALGAILYHIRR